LGDRLRREVERRERTGISFPKTVTSCFSDIGGGKRQRVGLLTVRDGVGEQKNKKKERTLKDNLLLGRD